MIAEMLEISAISLIVIEIIVLFHHLHVLEKHEKKLEESIRKMIEHIKIMEMTLQSDKSIKNDEYKLK